MGEQCTVLDELIKSKDLQEFGIFASRNCFGGLLSGKKRVIIVPPPAEQKKLFALTGEKAIEALKQLIIPRPGKTVSVAELAKKGELVAVNGTAVYPMTESKVADAKIVKTIESRNGLIIVVDKIPSSSGTRDVKKSEDGPIRKTKKTKGGAKKKIGHAKKFSHIMNDDKKMSGGKKKTTKSTRRPGSKKKKMMRGGNGYSLDITLNNNDLRSKVITIYKNRFSNSYSYPWYYYLYGNLLSYLSATERDSYLKYYWLIKMDPYSAVGGFLTPFMKRSYQYYPLSDSVIQKWSRSGWWCNPSIRTGFSYAVYGGMHHDAKVLGGDPETTTITISSYQDSLSRAYSDLISWLKTKGQGCNKFEKMAKVKEFFKRASGEHGSYGIYKELPSADRWKALYYYAIYDYVCSRRTEFSVGDKTLREIVDRVFSNLESVFDETQDILNDEGIKKFVENIGQKILGDDGLKKKVLIDNAAVKTADFGSLNPSFTDKYKKDPVNTSTNASASTATPSSTPSTSNTSASTATPSSTQNSSWGQTINNKITNLTTGLSSTVSNVRGGQYVQIPYSSGMVNADHAWGAYHGGKKKKTMKKKKPVKKVGGAKKKKTSPGPVNPTGKRMTKRPGTKKKKQHKKKTTKK